MVFICFSLLVHVYLWCWFWEYLSGCLTNSQFSSVAQSCPTLCDSVDCSTPGLPIHHQLPEFTQTHVHWVGDAIQPSHPLSSPSPPTFNLSLHQFSSVQSLSHVQLFVTPWPQHARPPCPSPTPRVHSNPCSLFAVQGTLKSLLQHHSSKASILWHSAFFTVQFSHPNMATGKTIALTRRTFVGKVMSLLFNMLSRSVITFLPRSKRLLISWLLISRTLSSSCSGQSYLSLHIHLQNIQLLSLICSEVFSGDPCANSHSPSSRSLWLLRLCVTRICRLLPTLAFQVFEAIASHMLLSFLHVLALMWLLPKCSLITCRYADSLDSSGSA